MINRPTTDKLLASDMQESELEIDSSAERSVIRKRVPAVRRAAAILTLLADHNSTMSLSEIARGVDILPSSCLQLLRELVAARLVAVNKRFKTYTLGPKIIELARAASRQDPIAELVQPYLHEIANSCGVTATASARSDDDHMVLVAFAHPRVSMSLNVTLGGRVPLFSGAAGRCLAAFGNFELGELKEAFATIRWQTPITFDAWINEVDTVKHKGYSEDKGVFTKGVTTIAVPMFSPDGTVRCVIGVGAISAQLDMALKKKIIAILKKSVRDMSR